MSLLGRSVVLCVFILAVSASVTDKILKISLFEVGELWINSVHRLNTRFVDYVISLCDVYSPLFYVGLAVLAVVGYYLGDILFRPYNRIVTLGDLGYLPDGKFTKKEIANSVKRRRAVGDIPPIYPNGWYGVLESWRLKNGGVTTTHLIGIQLAVFRDEKGNVHAVDAYCPHMGANLGVGGRVSGDCIECPFHGWKFRGDDGKCTHIPYSDKVPEVANIKSYTTMELNGGGAYVDANGARGDHVWRVAEIPENGADVFHLIQVHQPFIAAGYDLTQMWSKYFNWGKHNWTASWSQMPKPEEHIGEIKLTHDLSLFGISLPFVKLNVHAFQIGPAIVYLKFESFFGRGVFIQSLTPTEPLVQKLVHNIYIHWSVPNFIAKFFMYGECVQVERDIMIWNNKTYAAKPVFAKSKEDSLIARHRRWYSMFYSKNSPRLTFQKNDMDW
ncbi:NVD-like protein [Mya arenaria]|uniref:cholesterol 7-desaturase n=1 Tax=Mya arenaria TaxID=6604 RepID=A0ABY7GAW8_MYAAR|nr:NVD-like protein [Mya arenaria]